MVTLQMLMMSRFSACSSVKRHSPAQTRLNQLIRPGPIRAALDGDYEFEFVQGQVQYQEQHGMLFAKDFNGSKLYCYYNNLDLEETLRTEQELIDLAFEDGPYDGVIGYSQGAQLAASAMIRFQRENPNASIAEQPFRWAVFFGGPTPNWIEPVSVNTPLTPLTDIDPTDSDFAMLIRMNKDNPMLSQLQVNGTDGISQLMAMVQAKPAKGAAPAKSTGAAIWPVKLPFGQRGLSDGKYVLSKCDSEIDGTLLNKVATLHVRSEDDFVELGEAMYKLCDPKLARQYFHPHKHDFPRGTKQMSEITELIKATADDPRIA